MTDTIYEWSFANTSAGKQRLALNATLEPGTYVLDPLGTDNKLSFQNTAGTNPYLADGLLQFENYVNQAYTKVYYGFYYDWEISVGTPCARTPVLAVTDNALCPVSIDKPIKQSFTMYPNPAKEQISVSISKLPINNDEIQILNEIGQIVIQQQLEARGSQFEAEINISMLPAGIYFIKLGNETQKLNKY